MGKVVFTADIPGIHSLQRYYHLIVFQAYLDDTRPDDEEAYTFEQFVKHRPGT